MDISQRLLLVNKTFEECKSVVDEYVDTLKYKKTFLKRIYLMKETSGEAWSGGANRKHPRIQYSLNDRYFDKEKWLKKISTITNVKKINWRQVKEQALLDNWIHVEYTRIFTDPIIGGFISDNPVDHVRCAMAHEMAHVIHYWNKYYNGKDLGPHGPVWRNIYRILRREWVNKSLGNIGSSLTL